MKIQIACPLPQPYPLDYLACHEPMILIVDDDRNGLGFLGPRSCLEKVAGACPHVGAVNMLLSELGASDPELFDMTEWGVKLLAEQTAVLDAEWEALALRLDDENQPDSFALAELTGYDEV